MPICWQDPETGSWFAVRAAGNKVLKDLWDGPIPPAGPDITILTEKPTPTRLRTLAPVNPTTEPDPTAPEPDPTTRPSAPDPAPAPSTPTPKRNTPMSTDNADLTTARQARQQAQLRQACYAKVDAALPELYETLKSRLGRVILAYGLSRFTCDWEISYLTPKQRSALRGFASAYYQDTLLDVGEDLEAQLKPLIGSILRALNVE